MLSTIKGIYENGKIIFTEEPPSKIKSEILITFLNDLSEDSSLKNNQIRFGSLKGKINFPADFNEPINDLKEYM
ncbi:MAG: hypothetical protein JHD28_00655 [Bacteroidia bacterium]|nr:hypothetical protein [Bacteroidia bacterium]